MGKNAIVTGSSGLIGSEMVATLDRLGWAVHGVDNNMRRDFFGPDGDTTGTLRRLLDTTRQFRHYSLDIRDRQGVRRLIDEVRPDLIVHAAAQPSHDLAARRAFDDFDVNAVGTLNLLEAARAGCPDSPFAFLSTNKVYGDSPNELELVELDTRFDYADVAQQEGIDEQCRIDATTHSLFGASKVAADILVQEYGRYFGMPTVCFRGGCLTGSNHASAELHGFLAYLARSVRERRTYRIYGYKGKQVRDNIHARDVSMAIMAFWERPKVGAVYNLGGGRVNSVSILEAIARFEELFGDKLDTEYLDEPRRGDHVCYITDLRRIRSDYPEWSVTVTLDEIFRELVEAPTDWFAASR